jgi:hypothetical protein
MGLQTELTKDDSGAICHSGFGDQGDELLELFGE